MKAKLKHANQSPAGLELPEAPEEPAKLNPWEISPEARVCRNCNAWTPKPLEVDPFFAGCARGGTTTVHYGDTMFRFYRADMDPACSRFQKRG